MESREEWFGGCTNPSIPVGGHLGNSRPEDAFLPTCCQTEETKNREQEEAHWPRALNELVSEHRDPGWGGLVFLFIMTLRAGQVSEGNEKRKSTGLLEEINKSIIIFNFDVMICLENSRESIRRKPAKTHKRF